jgi:hypothetical protein
MAEETSTEFKTRAREQFLETEREIAKAFLIVTPILLVFIAGEVEPSALTKGAIIFFALSLLLSFCMLLEIKEISRFSWQVGFIAERQKEKLAEMLRSRVRFEDAWDRSNAVVAPQIQKVTEKRSRIDKLVRCTMLLFVLGTASLVISLLLGKG